MSKLQEDVARAWQADEWHRVPIGALLEALRRVHAQGACNSSLSAPVSDLPAFARRFAERRLLDRLRRRQRDDSQARPDSEPATAGVAAIDAIDWLFSTLDQLERGELPRDILVPTKAGPARLRLQNPVNVARTLRGLYIEGRDGSEVAAMLQVPESQVSKYRAAGLRYIQLLAAKELP